MDSQKAVKKRRDVVVVGMALMPSSRELLTWTLAKFTKPGNEVVALHIVSTQQLSSLSSVQTGIRPNSHAVASKSVMQGEVERIFDSVAGVYNGFCSVKQIKLQLKVICTGSTVREALVEEVRQYNTVRLILGASGIQEGTEISSFGLAKYCSTHLPSTCSILVIQHGQVVMEEAGLLTPGDSSKGVDVVRDKTAAQRSSNNARRKFNGQIHNDSAKPPCIRCSSNRIRRDLSGHIVHPYKYIPPQVQGLRKCILEPEKPSTMAAISSSRAKCPIPRIKSGSWSHLHNDSCSANEFSEDLSGQKNSIQKSITLDPEHCQKKVTNMPACHRKWPLVKTDWKSSKTSSGLQTPDLTSNKSDCKTEVKGQNRHTTSDIPQGWPLLHRSITKLDKAHLRGKVNCESARFEGRNRHTTSDIPQGWPLLHPSITKLDNAHLMDRKMSVLEWVLQLPERSKGVVEQSLETTVIQEMPICSAAMNEQTLTDFSNQEAKHQVQELDFGKEVEKSLLQKCYELCKGSSGVAFRIEDLEKSTNNFSKDNMIGKGGCSRVYRGVLSDARVVAIKCFDILAASVSENEFLTELDIVSSLHHRHISELFGFCVDNQQRCFLVYKFATEGNLEQKLHQDDKGVLPWSVRYIVALGIGEALEYIHNLPHRPVVHRDVKSSNILLQSDFTPQLTDFGLSKWASTSSTFLTCNDVVGTFGYIAPEYFMFGKVSDKTDVFSYGVVLLELVSGKHPIENVGSTGQENLILWAKPLLDGELSRKQIVDKRLATEYDMDELQNMLIAASLCLQHSPQARPSMSEVLKVLRGENVDLELRQDSMSIDGSIGPSHRDYDMHNHLTLALYGLDDDSSSRAGSDQEVRHARSNKLIEEYLRGRCSHSSSFDSRQLKISLKMH